MYLMMIKKRVLSSLLTLLLFFALTCLVSEAEEAGDKPTTKSQQITMNFEDVDVRVLVRFIGDLTGMNFVVDPEVKGKVTVFSPTKITVDEAYKVFLSVLEVHGFAAVPAGKVVKIIQAVRAKEKGIETSLDGKGLTRDDRIVTQLVPLKRADCVLLSKLLKPLIDKNGALIPYEKTGSLIIVDVKSNISRLVDIINELDVIGDRERIEVIPLRNARAETLSQNLLKLFQEKKSEGMGTVLKIIADARTNCLVLMALPETIDSIKATVQELDTDQVRPQENVHVFNLENAVAEEVVKVLSDVAVKGSKPTQGKPPVLSSDIIISSHKGTNTLVIIASPDEYLILEKIIKDLDRPRTMIYVEGLIVEVSAQKALALGVEWRVGNEYEGGFGAGKRGGVWFGGSTTDTGNLSGLVEGAVPSGFAAGIVGRGITLGNVLFPSVGAFIQAVQTDADFNILSTPQILTLDNEEAQIEIGRNLPFVTRVDQGSNVLDRSIQNFEYKDIGVTLKVTPQINQSRFIRLKVEESVKSVISSTALGGTVLAPTTTYRTAKTTITVRDGETAVIGGLIENRMDKNKTETPCLGGFPVFGWLFKNISDRDEKTNLLVFLQPRIVGTPGEGNTLYEEKKKVFDSKEEKESDAQRFQDMRNKALR
ncbi:MAG: type II secretion system protein GspD [Deltaproteobacteria bacterium HGW-Deltaproteobacteria-15]|jgi:general secretion pathway protein D|nr:MAG: type II secretion system protein GspD [Deltaproteobacteria bacterium HGW-Deltaproteobacteria-15]